MLRFIQTAVMLVLSAALALSLTQRWRTAPWETLAFIAFVGFAIYLNRRFYHGRPPSPGVWLFYLLCFLVSFTAGYVATFAR